MRLIRLLAAAALAVSAWALSGGSQSLAAPSNSARTALLIANAAYADGDAELTTPVGDAEKLAEALKRLGFQTQIALNLRKKAMDDAIEGFLNRLEPGAVVVFFFAGYGIQAGGKNYLIPIDPRIWTEGDILREAVSVEDLQAKFAKRDVKARIVILEAARRNPFERRFRSVSSGLAPSPSLPGLIRFYSATNTILADAPGAKNSPLITELAPKLTPDRHAAQAFELARDEISRQSKNPQAPYLTSGLAEPLWLDASQQQAAAPAAETPKSEPKPKPEPASKPVEPAPKPVSTPKPAESAHLGSGSVSETPKPAEPKPGISQPETKPAPPPIKEYTTSEAARKAELDARIARDPGDEASISERGQLLALHRDYKAALADFDESTRLNPGNVQSWNNRCWVRAIANELSRAIDDCNEALKRRPKFADALDSRGLVRLKQGDAEAANADYSAALRINPAHASALYGRGLARLRLDDAGGAESDIAKARSINPAIELEFKDYGLK